MILFKPKVIEGGIFAGVIAADHDPLKVIFKDPDCYPPMERRLEPLLGFSWKSRPKLPVADGIL